MDRLPGDCRSFAQRLLQARAGDETALGELLEQQRGLLTALAQLQLGRRLQGKADAADLVQETFLEAHRAFGRFRGTTQREFARWLRGILSKRLAHLIRYHVTQRRDLRLERQFSDPSGETYRLDGGLVAKHASPSQEADQREQAEILAGALEQLSPRYRAVLMLRHVQGLTFPEIAQEMNRSVDSVEKLWSRALRRLRRILGDGPRADD